MTDAPDPFSPSAAVAVLGSPQPLYVPRRPMTWAMDRIETALRDLQTAGVSGWRSVLADCYRDELDDLARELRQLRDDALEAERSYDHLRYVARMNGER